MGERVATRAFGIDRAVWPVVAALLAACAAGCALQGPGRRSGLAGEYQVFGYSVEGRPIRGVVFGHGSRTTLLFGVIHGNEPLGEPLLERFTGLVAERPDWVTGRRVIIVPVLNPDGLERGTRRNSRGVDLNRNFPASNFRAGSARGPHPESEPETRTLVKILRRYRPERVLSVHSPLHCVNWDGPAGPLAERMAAASGYPLKPSIGYPTPGSLGSYAGIDLGIPTITLELPGKTTADAVWRQCRDALIVFLTAR